jgi:hypothetical protein
MMDPKFVIRGRLPRKNNSTTKVDNWKMHEAISAWNRLEIDNIIKHDIDRTFYNLKFGYNNWKIQIGKDWSSGKPELQVEIWVRGEK